MCSGPMRMFFGIEIDEIAGADVDRADAEPLAAVVEKVEIDRALSSVCFSGRRIVIAGRAVGAGRLRSRDWCGRGLKKSGLAEHHASSTALVWLRRSRK